MTRDSYFQHFTHQNKICNIVHHANKSNDPLNHSDSDDRSQAFIESNDHDSPRTPNVHISGPRPSETPPKFHARTPRERKKKENCGGGGKKKARNFRGGGLSGGGLSGGGLSSGGGFTGGGVSSGFWGRKQKQHRNKMKREMSKNKKKVKKS